MTRRAVLLAGASPVACREQKRPLRLLTFPESYGHHLSIGQGFYKAAGIDVAATYFQSFPKMMEALLAGDGDVATAYYDALLPLAAAGRDTVAFLGLARRPGSVLASATAQSIEELAGKIVGIPGPGSSSHNMLNAILRKHGIDIASVKTAAIGVAAGAVAAVEQRKVDAAMLTNLGYATLHLRMPKVRLLADLRTPDGAARYLGSAEYPSLCLVARASWLDANVNDARAFAKAFLRANQWMSAHTAEQIREALPSEARAADPAADSEAIRGMLPTLSVDGKVSEDGAAAVLAITAASVPGLESLRGKTASTLRTLL
ncbi:MAG: ABC transporter substrate-binding protein [Candidatus Solibacter usitatus]|nr:ABC transporter substrate-binding protein [Candidatus Solibacter usitatus]